MGRFNQVKIVISMNNLIEKEDYDAQYICGINGCKQTFSTDELKK